MDEKKKDKQPVSELKKKTAAENGRKTAIRKKKPRSESAVIASRENGKKHAARISQELKNENAAIEQEYIEEIKNVYGQKHLGYSEQLADIVLKEIVSRPHSLQRICKEHPDLPNHATIYYWIATNPDFSKKYASAKAFQAQILAEQITQIADGERDDSICDNVENNLARAELRMRARQWYVSRLLPKIYGTDKANQRSEEDGESAKLKLEEMRTRIDELLLKHEKDY